MCAALVATSVYTFANEPLKLEDMTKGAFAAKTISGINPLRGTSDYAQISADRKKIVAYSFVTGKETGVLFDFTKYHDSNLKSIEDYEITGDGQFILIQTDTKRIYRRSFTADFLLYDVKNKSLKTLSKDGPQQIPTFSPNGKYIAFVRNNNIFITDGTTEKQITTDGKFNEIINGVPDWVNEEEFGFNNALAWSADSKTLSWIRYDESKVKTYSLQMFEGAKPTFKQYAVYPGLYSYKYPKAGEDNSKVSVHAYSLESGKTITYNFPLDSDGYIPRIKSTKFADRIIIYTMNRHQDELNLYKANPTTGECNLLIKENANKYVKEEAMGGIRVMNDYILFPLTAMVICTYTFIILMENLFAK